MTPIEFQSILPLIIVAAAPIIIMLVASVKRSHLFVNIFSLVAFALALISVILVSNLAPVTIVPLFIFDKFSFFYIGLILSASFLVTLLSFGYFEQYEGDKEEFYILLFIATLGSSLLVASIDFISFFLGLEILSVSLYVLISYFRTNENGLEGGIKYLVLAATSAAFLLFGMALVYSGLGTMAFNQFTSRISSPDTNLILAVTGFSMIIIGVGFKLALVPFHLWTPDVYQGAPAPVTAFIATVSKGGMFALMLRLFVEINVHQYPSLILTFTIIAAASMLIGNLLAIRQNNIKRILAYSSIAHLGYVLVAFLATGSLGIQAVTFYLVAYFITTLGAFGVVTVLSVKDHEAEDIKEYEGLFWSHPVIAAVFTVMLFSLAGIPLTIGFISKYYVLAAGINSSLWFLVIVLVVSSAVGLYYYLRIITAMYRQVVESYDKSLKIKISFPLSGGIALTILTVLLIWYGIFPSALITAIQSIINIKLGSGI
ncbi:NADH:ubiquinone oxidoreductase, membrane subunit N [Candidatus Kuenenia stuttgartiensis]|uniref:NADH-quinone oxidoreductase subunit N n=1 Tax=Kuenenia stuttgartiensis TaxID=174633 RepID=Q1Q768_KUEST|nr:MULTISPECIES: NADH-quinone oxidoreductase subunit N [Kuenenia]MBE7549031.1 NADH-quinone oxidoreductase subunit N [Planctomycetia bacterium]MBZ0190737.1 NADH-quinone oxidoreductase subunit N [Candidatus Kuenenia stuttgartiensis]MCF6151563.1 NADH-quinone oxidoreductase subunit N [Candidatus Kuenenia stuttgartiensis]MCL4727310.1 NADH-quinone oxidoreductase subunit N [Candidatus Kuenenia stuttgartiensis]MCZ7621931.1 NADH-quinone oxidoreductase subunit N [Candidatus Kuenenia sp.]